MTQLFKSYLGLKLGIIKGVPALKLEVIWSPAPSRWHWFSCMSRLIFSQAGRSMTPWKIKDWRFIYCEPADTLYVIFLSPLRQPSGSKLTDLTENVSMSVITKTPNSYNSRSSPPMNHLKRTSHKFKPNSALLKLGSGKRRRRRHGPSW